MSEPDVQALAMKRYSLWILAPLVALVAMLLLLRPDRGGVGGFDDASFVRTGNEGRTVRAFGQDADAVAPAEQPLFEVNHEGIELDIRLDAETWSRMLIPSNRTVYRDRATNATLRFGDRPPRPATLRVRGGGSLTMPGKPSFNLKLLHDEQIAPGIHVRHLYLANMRYDRVGVKTRFGYGLARDLGLFEPHVQFVRVSVNGTPMGVYLLIEPPERAIRRAHPDAVAVYRRWNLNRFERLWSQRVPLQDKRIDQLVALGVAGDDAPVARRYEEVLDVEQFLTWLAMNSAILNVDTADELFVYETREPGDAMDAPGRLHVMAWDLEDILQDKPTPESTTDPLLYAFRDAHERHVQRDPELNARLRQKLRGMVDHGLSLVDLRARLLAAQALRNRMDDDELRDGHLTAAAAAEAKAAREAFVVKAIETLERRHAQLLVETATPSTQPE